MYTLKYTTNVNDIKETEWGIGPQVQFAKFTSCIGVLSKVQGKDNVIGIHLVLVDHDGNNINPEVISGSRGVKDVLRGLNYDPAKTKVIGHIDYWIKSAPTVLDRLIKELGFKDRKDERLYQFGDGNYGGKITDGDVEITAPP